MTMNYSFFLDAGFLDQVQDRLERCLLCGSCAAACPSGVSALEIFLEARTVLADYRGLPLLERLILRGIVAHPRLFDLAVNVGPFRAHCMLQIALNRSGVRVNIDGIIGPRTLWAVNHHPVPGYVSAELRLAAIRYYVSLERDRYERGWIRRVLANPGGSP